VYEDELIRLVLDVEDTPENRDWFSPMEGNAEGTVSAVGNLDGRHPH
jgi:hypothetical protein